MFASLGGSGLLVGAIDLTNAPEAPYHRFMQDANYGVALAQVNGVWNGDARGVGIYASRSGGAMWRSCSRCVRMDAL